MQKLTLDYILVNHILQHLMKLSLPTPLSSAPTILPITKRFWWPRTRSLPPHASATTRRGSRSNGALYIFFFRLFARSYCPLLLTFTGPYFDAHYPSDCYPIQIQSSNALPDFFAYIDWERSHRGSDSFAVRTLFERAVAVHCLVPSLWEEYLYYLVSHRRLWLVFLGICEDEMGFLLLL